MVRMIHILLAHKRENHVVRVEIARRREQLITVEFHPFAQVEGVDLAILAYLPAFRQARHQFGSARFEIDQTVINRYGAGVHAGPRRIELRIEIFRRSFGAIHQRFCRDGGTDRQCSKRQRYHCECAFHHLFLSF